MRLVGKAGSIAQDEGWKERMVNAVEESILSRPRLRLISAAIWSRRAAARSAMPLALILSVQWFKLAAFSARNRRRRFNSALWSSPGWAETWMKPVDAARATRAEINSRIGWADVEVRQCSSWGIFLALVICVGDLR